MNCPNCFNKYSEEIYIPRILNNCGHTICENCITKTSKKSKKDSDPHLIILCPCCSKETFTKEILSLTKNLALIEFAISQHSNYKSESNLISINQISTHSEISSLNNYATTDYMTKNTKKSKILCSEHFKDLDAFCDSCKKLLCVSCIIEKDHKNHDLLSYEKAFHNECISFNKNFEKIEKEEENFEKIQNELNCHKESLQKKYEKQLETIQNFFHEVYAVLNQREKVLKEKLLNENEIEERILNGFEERMSMLKMLVEKIKNLKNNYDSSLEFEILSNSLDTGKTYKDISDNIVEIEKLSVKKEFQFSQLERESEISVLKELLHKNLLPQINLTTNSDKTKIPENSLKKSSSITKTKKISMGSLNTSIHKLNPIPPSNIEPLKFNFIKSEADYNYNYKKSNKALKLFPQLKSKPSEILVTANTHPNQASTKLLPTSSNLNNVAKKNSDSVNKIALIEKNEVITQKDKESEIGVINNYLTTNNILNNNNEITNITNVDSSNSDFSIDLDDKEFKESNAESNNIKLEDAVDKFEDNLANTSHFMQTMNAINSNQMTEIYSKNDSELILNNKNKYNTHNPSKLSNPIHDSNIFYQLNDQTNLRDEIDLNDFQMGSPDKVLNEIKKNVGNGMILLPDMNNISNISHLQMKSSYNPNDISSIYNKPVNPFVVVLGGKCEYKTKRYSVDQANWIASPNPSYLAQYSSNNVISNCGIRTASSNPSHLAQYSSNNVISNNGINSNNNINNYNSTNNTENILVNFSSYDYIKIERSDFVALMYKEKKILIIGGKTLNEKGVEVITNSIDLLNIKEKNLSRLSIKLKYSLLNFGAVYTNSKLFIAGGFNGREALNNFEYFDKVNRTWVDLPKMWFKRKEFSMVMGPDNCLYAIGGADDRDIVTKSVEKFDLVKNCWTRITDMNQKRKGCSGVCMPDGIYIIGGFDGCQYLKSVERYDFLTKKWVYIEDMNYPRCLFSSCVSSDLQYIYVVGGYDGKPLNSLERYDVFMNKWEILEKMNSPRYRHQCIFLKE